jgi:hypothetical protein
MRSHNNNGDAITLLAPNVIITCDPIITLFVKPINTAVLDPAHNTYLTQVKSFMVM